MDDTEPDKQTPDLNHQACATFPDQKMSRVIGSVKGLHAKQNQWKIYETGNLNESDGPEVVPPAAGDTSTKLVISAKDDSTRSDSQDGTTDGQSLTETGDGVLHSLKMVPPVPVRKDSFSSSDGESDSETAVERTTRKPFNYCNIAVLLNVFFLYLKYPSSPFNKWISALKLKEFQELKTMEWISAIEHIVSGHQEPTKNDCFGNPFERILKFAERHGHLKHQQYYKELGKCLFISYTTIHNMITNSLKEDKVSLQQAVNNVLSGANRRPYTPLQTAPYLPFHLLDRVEKSSQLPSTLYYPREDGSKLAYQLGGVIFHRSNNPDNVKHHYVVRGFDPTKNKWFYNDDADGPWEEDSGDPTTNIDFTFRLSTVIYIVADPPGTDLSLAQSIQCSKPPN